MPGIFKENPEIVMVVEVDEIVPELEIEGWLEFVAVDIYTLEIVIPVIGLNNVLIAVVKLTVPAFN